MVSDSNINNRQEKKMLGGQVENIEIMVSIQKKEDTIKDTAPRNRVAHQVTQENFVEEASCVSAL